MSEPATGRFSLEGRRVWVAGHGGMAGAAIMRRLAREGAVLVTATRAELDLTRQAEVEAWLSAQRPEVVVLAAARVGGIQANQAFPVEFLRDNLVMETNVIHAAHASQVRKLLFLASSCLYPRLAPQPMKEEHLLTGPLEPTNEWYAIAKIAGLKLCEAYRRQHGCDFLSLMPTNLYGPGDNYHPTESHVPGALIRRFHEAREGRREEVVVWGTGKPRRDFLFVDDLADACAFTLANSCDASFLNVGSGRDVTIAEFAATVAEVVGFRGRIVQDAGKPDGAPRKLLDVSRLAAMGWRARTPLKEGLAKAYADFLAGGGRFRDAV